MGQKTIDLRVTKLNQNAKHRGDEEVTLTKLEMKYDNIVNVICMYYNIP